MNEYQIMAVGSLEDDNGSTECTGTLIRSNWVITAAHCDSNRIQWFRTGINKTDSIRVSIIRRLLYPQRDVMLLEIQKSDVLDNLSIQPIEPWGDRVTDEWLGSFATLVGFGYTESGEIGDRLFLSEPIVEITPTTVIVDGKGESGACTGDSGGPLLLHDENGTIRIIGVLIQGSSDCLGIDIYSRTDVLDDWISSTIDNAMENPCGTITAEGQCLGDGSAAYCENDRLVFDSCVTGSYCAFNVSANGYRCITFEEDFCMGIDELGTCQGQVAMRCRRGILYLKDCAACKQTCVVLLDGNAFCEDN
ncbi:MAG: S1 family peptidase [Proteobacteria bacterium]|nr:S1 family peptidase [Pseudomonadota bacterium]